MATTVGNHTVATFTSPVNGTSPIDADSVRANDNTLRTAYNTHDSDPGLHLQSSTFSTRPSAGTAGRKWITADNGSYVLWYDDGTRWHEVGSDGVDVEFIADGNCVKGDVLKLTGWNNGQNLPELAPLTSASDVAFAICTETVTNGTKGYAINTGFLEDVDTSGFSAGDKLYPNGTTGPGSITSWLTASKPTSGEYQTVAYVVRSNGSNGVLFVEFTAPSIVEVSANTANTVVKRDGSGDFSAGTITAALTGNASTATKLSSSRTFALTGDVTGSVSSDLTSGASITTSIAAGAIVNADISASAEIAVSKLADGAARQVLQTDASGNGVEWTSNVDLPGTLDVTGATNLDSTLGVTGNTTVGGTLGVTGATTLTSQSLSIGGVSYTFPAADGTSGQHLTTNGSGTLSWAPPVVPSTYGAVGTYVIAYVDATQMSNYTGGGGGTSAPGGTVSATYLHRSTASSNGIAMNLEVSVLDGSGGTTSLGLSGTWRSMSYLDIASESYLACLLIRIS